MLNTCLRLLGAVLLLLPAVVDAQFTYTTNNGTITIIAYTGSGGAVIIPSSINGLSVASIGTNAFFHNRTVTSVTIPNNVANLLDYAFAKCSSLTNIMIGSGVTNLGIGVFFWCPSLNGVTVDALNPGYCSVDGVLFNKNQTVLIQCPGGKGGSYSVPIGVTNIGEVAFSHCINLTNITIPDSVISIDDAAFNFCSSLASVTIPDGITSIGNFAFANCTNLASVTIHNTVASIGNFAFARDISLTNVIPGASITSIGNLAFANCTNLASIVLSDSLTNIGNGAFEFCTSLANVTMGAGVISIGDAAFWSCTSLNGFNLPDSVTNVGDYAFCLCTSLTNIEVSSNVINIGTGAFWECDDLNGITVDSLNPAYSSVDGVLFNKAQTTLIQYPGGKVGNYTIPSSVISIGSSAFFDCDSLDGVTIPNSVASIGDYAFSGCDNLMSITIPNSVTSIGDFAFSDCMSLTNITIGSSVTSIGTSPFGGCYIMVDALNPAYSSANGVLFDKNQTALIQCPVGLAGSYTIPDSVTNIVNNAFYGCTNLSNLTIGSGVTSIGNSLFSGCSNLACVTIGNSVTNIGNYAFFSCSSLVSITIPNSVSNIGSRAFSLCTSLKAVYFQGNAPDNYSDQSVFSGDPITTVYYLPGTTGWSIIVFDGRPTALWLPQVQTSDASFGVQANGFGFNLNWAGGQTVVVEACTNLANPTWQPVQTNTLTSGSAYFCDPQWIKFPGRFYRLRSVP